MSYRYDKYILDDDEGRDMTDESYDGHHKGYTYMGGGYYSNNSCTGSDEYVEISPSGRKEYHTTM